MTVKQKVIKVLQVGMTRNLGGIETYLIEQFRHLDTSRIMYDFVNITGEYNICFEEEIKAKGNRIFSFVSRHKNPFLHYWQWYRILRRHYKDYGVIVLNTNSLEYIYPLVLGKYFGIPVRVIHSHNTGFEKTQGISRRALVRMNTKLMNWSANVRLACSRAAGRWMFGNEAFQIVYNAIDVKKYVFNEEVRRRVRQDLQLDDALTLIHIGRFSYQKNHAFIVEVFNEVVRRRPNAILLLVGNTTEETLYLTKTRELIKQYGLENKVRFLGMRQDVPDLLQAADVLVMPSFFEGLSLVAVEAQAADLPALLSSAMTEEVKLIESTVFLGLNLGSEKWAETVMHSVVTERQSRYADMVKAGYEITHEVNRVEALYLDEYVRHSV